MTPPALRLFFITRKQFAASFGVCVSVTHIWQRAGLIAPVHLPGKPGGARPPCRFALEDVEALARRFRGGVTA